MRTIYLILSREVFTRVKTKQFWILSILGPLLMSAMIAIPILIDQMDETSQTIWVQDEAHLWEKLPQKNELKLIPVPLTGQKLIDSLAQDENLGLLTITSDVFSTDPGKGLKYTSQSPLSMKVEDFLNESISKTIEDKKLEENGVSRSKLDSLKTPDFKIKNVKPEGSALSSEKAFGLATVGSMLMYFFILIYGMQVLRGVSEEKSNRIMEVLISSVQPFQLMMGKILGIAATALLQFLLWIGLTMVVVMVVLPLFLGDAASGAAAAGPSASMSPDAFSAMTDVPGFVLVFFFYFIFGFLTYAALFAAIGSAVDQEQDAQQLTLPVTVPIIIAFLLAQTAVAQPHSATAFWSSMIPLTAPVVMMARFAYDAVAPWEMALSMITQVISFVFFTYISARVYRIGVLMYGKKVTLKEISKWVFKR
jgi:ABC-2 type transport system permease protein